MDKKELSFSPITEGLGFHPFSDGLPYAPVAKAVHQRPSAAPLPPRLAQGAKPTLPTHPLMSTGAGAVLAGPPSFVSPLRSTARVSVPVAGPGPAVTAPTQIAATVTRPLAPVFEQSSYGIFYVIKRMVAYSLDTCLNVGLCIGALSAALWRQNLNPDTLVSPGVVLPFVLFLIVFNWSLIAAQEVAFGTTVAKRVFGLSVEGSISAVFLRAFFFLPSLGFCGLGLAWALFDPKRRCWHDLVVDLQPAEIARL